MLLLRTPEKGQKKRTIALTHLVLKMTTPSPAPPHSSPLSIPPPLVAEGWIEEKSKQQCWMKRITSAFTPP